MSGDEPRRSVRSTKGVHNKNTEASSASAPKPTKSAKSAKSKPPKKSLDPQPKPEEEEDETIRCICGDDNPKDKRAFIGCDQCSVWQHNVCMGITDDSDDIPEQYFCEECRPEEHRETLQSKANDAPGPYIWEKRNKIYQNEKKMSKSRKNKGREVGHPGWLKKEIAPAAETQATDTQTTKTQPAEDPAAETPAVETSAVETPVVEPSVVETSAVETPAVETQATEPEPTQVQETGSKRKREESKEEVKEEEPTQPKRGGRGDKRRKSGPAAKVEPNVPDAEHAIVDIAQLPPERQKIAQTLSKIIADDISARVKTGYVIPDGRTVKSLGEHHATLIEYALHMNHGGQGQYGTQFRALNANMKKNKMLIERLLNGSVTADELAKMESKDLASEELQRERAEMKAELDRQAVAVEEDGPKFRTTHKGVERIEELSHHPDESSFNVQPVRERTQDEDSAGSPAVPQAGSPPTNTGPLALDTKGPSEAATEKRTPSQQFNMNDIWAKTAQSPSHAVSGARPMQMPPRRRSSVQPRPDQPEGAKVDADVDRMLEDNDDYQPSAELTSDTTIVWRGKLIQTIGEGEPTVNARFVAGRDLTPTVSWNELLPAKLSVDGRLQIEKAEDYLCGLEWSNTSDVSVLSLTPYDDADAFNMVFDYFHSRGRYAVVGKGVPPMIKDLYIIPVEVGASLPDHVTKLEHCTVKTPIESRLLLATFVVARSPDTPRNANPESTPIQRSGSLNGRHVPSHLQPGAPGPAGSPITGFTPSFSPSTGKNGTQPTAGYGAPNPFTPGPYGPPSSEQPQVQQLPPQYALHPNAAVNEILGPLRMAPCAQQILAADPNITVDKLTNLRRIMEEDPITRTDIGALATKLGTA